MSREAMEQALEALEIGYDSTKAEADHFHSAMAGYKPHRHAQIDADVQKIAKAITALRAELAEPEQPVAWADLWKAADEIVKSKSAWKRSIDGTPLANDIAVWMADFAHKYAHPPQHTEEK